MQITQILGFAATAAAAATGTGAVDWTTKVVTEYTTVCPYPTTWAFKNVTYTVSSSTTITVKDCPCTISYHQPPPVTTVCPVSTPGQAPYTSKEGEAPPPMTTSTITYAPTTQLGGTRPVTYVTPTAPPAQQTSVATSVASAATTAPPAQAPTTTVAAAGAAQLASGAALALVAAGAALVL